MFLLVWLTDSRNERRRRKSEPLIPLPRIKTRKKGRGTKGGGTGGTGGSSHTGVGPADGVIADKAEPGWWGKHTKSRSARAEWKPYEGIDLEKEEEARVIDEDDPDYIHDFEVDPEDDIVDLDSVDGIVVDSEGNVIEVDLDDRGAYDGIDLNEEVDGEIIDEDDPDYVYDFEMDPVEDPGVGDEISLGYDVARTE